MGLSAGPGPWHLTIRFRSGVSFPAAVPAGAGRLAPARACRVRGGGMASMRMHILSPEMHEVPDGCVKKLEYLQGVQQQG